MTKMWKALSLLVCASVVAAGCETASGSAAGGAAIGAGIGAIIGNQSGRAGQGALIGALAGGLAGLVVHDIRAKQSRTAQQTAQQYNYTPAQGEVMQVERTDISPRQVAKGQKVSVTVEYALLGSGAQGVQVTETRSLKKGNEVLAELSSKTFTRSDGTWSSTMDFTVPNDLDIGTYSIVNEVKTPSARVSASTTFTVI